MPSLGYYSPHYSLFLLTLPSPQLPSSHPPISSTSLCPELTRTRPWSSSGGSYGHQHQAPSSHTTSWSTGKVMGRMGWTWRVN